MGFKASDNQKTANMKGVSDIDIAIIEEAEDIRDVAKYNSFTDGLRKEGCLIIIILNTPDLNHWVLKRYFYTNIPAPPPENTPAHLLKDFDGYFEISPKPIAGFCCVKTGFEDNEFLPPAKVQEYKDYGNPESDRYDPHHYMTAIKGYSSSGRKGQVLKKVKEISLADYLDLPFTEFYGQDFGPAAPSPLVGVKFDKNNCYCREIDYSPKDVLEIGKLYCRLGFTRLDRIIADNADKEAWTKLRNGWKAHELSADDLLNYSGLLHGFNVFPCIKNGVKVGIDLLSSMNLYAVKESENLWREIQLRIYAQDKNGEYTNEPEPGNDHAMDGWIYVATDQRGRKKGGLSYA
jgi:phage terminase large subunit